MQITRVQLLAALLAAGVVHTAVAVAVLWAPAPPGVQAAGLNGVEISLGPSGGAPGGAVSQPAVPEQEEAPEEVTQEAADPPSEVEEVAENEAVKAEATGAEVEAPISEVQPAVEPSQVKNVAAKPPVTALDLPEVDPAETAASPVLEALPTDEPVPLEQLPDATIAYALPVKPLVQEVQSKPVEQQLPISHQVATEQTEQTELTEAVKPLEAVAADPPEPEELTAEAPKLPPADAVVALPPLPRARPVEVAKPQPDELAREPTELATTVSQPQAKQVPKPRSTETLLAKLTPQKTQRTTPSTSGAGGKSGSKDSANAGNGDNSKGGGNPGVAKDYMSFLLAWLHKHKEYPREARRRRQQGTAFLYFEMDRQGHVKDYRLESSSGYRSLDREVMALLRRAEPLPQPPPEVEGARIKLVVPVQFLIR